MKSLALPIFGLVGLAACGPEFAVIPLGGAAHVTANTQGVYLSAFADQWNAEPHDLADWLTPIAVDLYNGTNVEIRVALSDFSLHEENGAKVPALNPFAEPLASLDLTTGAEVADDDLALKTGPLLASAGPLVLAARGGGHGGGGHFSGGSRGGGHWGGGYRGGSHWGGYHWGGRYWGGARRWGPGFRVVGRLRGYYGPGVLYWGGPWLWGTYGYGAWGYGPPPADVYEYALPEGVLAPGSHVNGFLYFHKATGPDVRGLQLSWQPVDANTGAPVGEAAVALQVVHR